MEKIKCRKSIIHLSGNRFAFKIVINMKEEGLENESVNNKVTAKREIKLISLKI